MITGFAGLRAHEDGHEFVIQEVEDAPGFIDCAGIESPGLTSAPAIGRLAAENCEKCVGVERKPCILQNQEGNFKSGRIASKREK